MVGRMCECGCGRGIEHMKLGARFHPVCAADRENEWRRRNYAAKKANGTLPPKKRGARHRSPKGPQQPVLALVTSNPRSCHSCAGQAHRRIPGPLCPGCGRLFEPERVARGDAPLRSNAGMAIRT